MTILELYKNLPFDNFGIMPIFDNEIQQNAYFDRIALKPENYRNTDVTFNKIGEPIILRMPYDIALGYSYGRIKFNEKWIYFSVTDVTVNTEGRSVLAYTLDCWNTSRHQYGVTLGTTHISRRKATSNARPRQPFSPVDYTHSNIEGLFTGYCIAIAVSQIKVRDDIYDSGVHFILYKPDTGFTTKWLDAFKTSFEPSDVLGAWVVPFDIDANLPPALWIEHQNAFEETFYETTFPVDRAYRDIMPKRTIAGLNLLTDELHLSGFADADGVISYIIPHNRTINSIEMRLRISAQTCHLLCVLNGFDVKDKVNNYAFEIPCKPVDIVIDAWAEYCARTRDFEMQSRKIQNEQQLVNSVTSIGTGSLTGAIVGGGVGAVAGAAASVVGSLVSYGMSQYYEPKIQNITDTMYRHAQDTLSISGLSCTDFLANGYGLYKFTLTADDYSIGRMDDDINTNGSYVDETTENGDNLIIEQPLQCNTHILGNIPSNWKEQIAQRFRNGVKLKVIQ